MVRLMCKAALGAALITAVAWVGLAWSQSPDSPAADASSTQVTMTVHENGKAIQCKMVKSWRCPNGARAFQLEVLDTGEKLTMVEDGPGTSFQSKAGRMRSLPMRIFHWGRAHTSPPGAPMPPPQMISSQDIGPPTVVSESDPVLVRISPDPVAPPGCQICSNESVPAETVASDKCAKPGVAAAPAIGPPPALPAKVAGSVASAGPASSASGPQLIPIDPRLPPGTATPLPASVPPPGLSGSCPVPGSLPAGVAANAMDASPAATMPPAYSGSTASNAGARNPQAQHTRSRGLLNRLRTALIVDKKNNQPSAVRPAPEPLNNRVSPDPQKAMGPQLADMARGQLPAPGSLPSMSRNAAPLAGKTGTTGNAAAPGTVGSSLPSLPATAQGPATLPGMTSPPATTGAAGSPPGSFARPQRSDPSAADTRDLSSLMGPANNAPSSSRTRDNDWRTSWGRPPAGMTPPPGQSVVEPPPAGKGPAIAGMRNDPPVAPFAPMPPASRAQGAKQADPLLNPERYSKLRVENKAYGDRRLLEAARPRDLPPDSPLPATNAPAGVQSVIAANNGMDMPLRFVPVPMVTVPQPMRPPGPPKPEVPQPPAPAAWTNAFAPVKQSGAPNGQPPAAPPAPGVPMPGTLTPGSPTPAMPGIPMPPTAGMLPYAAGAYGPQVDPRMLMGMPRMQAPAMASPYGPITNANPYANPAMTANAGPRPPMPNGAVGSGQWPWDNDAAPPFSAYKSQRPVAHIAYPQTYAGPMAPNPTARVNMPGMTPPAMRPYPQGGYMPPPAAMPVPAPMYPPPMAAVPMPAMPPMPQLAAVASPPDMAIDPASVQQWLGVLRNSPYPAQREWAAINLVSVDLQASPDVLEALLTAAKKDPAATVRAGCVQCLARQNLTSQPVLTTLHALASDPDPRVRTEAEQSLIRLTGSHSTPPRPIQPVNARQ